MLKTGIQNFRPVNIPVGNIRPDGAVIPKDSAGIKDTKFEDILKAKIGDSESVKFSSHAVDRLNSRNISLSYDDITRINKAVSQAEGKGAKDSLVVMNNLAFIVSVENKTVITAMSKEAMQENVFTNIDSAVFV